MKKQEFAEYTDYIIKEQMFRSEAYIASRTAFRIAGLAEEKGDKVITMLEHTRAYLIAVCARKQLMN